MVVVLLLALIWAAVLVPPAVQAHAARREAFLVSFGARPSGQVLQPSGEVFQPSGEVLQPSGQVLQPSGEVLIPRSAVRSPQVRRRRHIVASLLLAMAGTGLAGLLPTFRVLLVVHLFLDDSFLAYVALLALQADRRAKGAAVDHEAKPVPDPSPARPRSRRGIRRPGILVDLPLGPSPL
jgi:hypothetical protein